MFQIKVGLESVVYTVSVTLVITYNHLWFYDPILWCSSSWHHFQILSKSICIGWLQHDTRQTFRVSKIFFCHYFMYVSGFTFRLDWFRLNWVGFKFSDFIYSELLGLTNAGQIFWYQSPHTPPRSETPNAAGKEISSRRFTKLWKEEGR